MIHLVCLKVLWDAVRLGERAAEIETLEFSCSTPKSKETHARVTIKRRCCDLWPQLCLRDYIFIRTVLIILTTLPITCGVLFCVCVNDLQPVQTQNFKLFYNQYLGLKIEILLLNSRMAGQLHTNVLMDTNFQMEMIVRELHV